VLAARKLHAAGLLEQMLSSRRGPALKQREREPLYCTKERTGILAMLCGPREPAAKDGATAVPVKDKATPTEPTVESGSKGSARMLANQVNEVREEMSYDVFLRVRLMSYLVECDLYVMLYLRQRDVAEFMDFVLNKATACCILTYPAVRVTYKSW
ncbi:unnamed protein product, partial [Symbiodinium necroappetens]